MKLQELICILHEVNNLNKKIRTNEATLVEIYKLGWLTKKHHKLCELYCNYEIDFNLIIKQEKRVLKQVNKINEMIKTIKVNQKINVEFTRDPRGLTQVKLFNGNQFVYYLWYTIGR